MDASLRLCFVVESTSVADTRQYQPMSYSIEMGFVVRKPGDRTDRCRNEQDAEAQSSLALRLPHCQRDSHGYSGKIIVRAITGDGLSHRVRSCCVAEDSSLPLSAA